MLKKNVLTAIASIILLGTIGFSYSQARKRKPSLARLIKNANVSQAQFQQTLERKPIPISTLHEALNLLLQNIKNIMNDNKAMGRNLKEEKLRIIENKIDELRLSSKDALLSAADPELEVKFLQTHYTIVNRFAIPREKHIHRSILEIAQKISPDQYNPEIETAFEPELNKVQQETTEETASKPQVETQQIETQDATEEIQDLPTLIRIANQKQAEFQQYLEQNLISIPTLQEAFNLLLQNIKNIMKENKLTGEELQQEKLKSLEETLSSAMLSALNPMLDIARLKKHYEIVNEIAIPLETQIYKSILAIAEKISPDFYKSKVEQVFQSYMQELDTQLNAMAEEIAEFQTPIEEEAIEEEAPIEEITPIEEQTPVEEEAFPIEEQAPIEEVIPTEEEAPIEEIIPEEEILSTEAQQIEEEPLATVSEEKVKEKKKVKKDKKKKKDKKAKKDKGKKKKGKKDKKVKKVKKVKKDKKKKKKSKLKKEGNR